VEASRSVQPVSKRTNVPRGVICHIDWTLDRVAIDDAEQDKQIGASQSKT